MVVVAYARAAAAVLRVAGAVMSGNDACSNSVVEAASSAALTSVLQAQLDDPNASLRPRFVFFDLDECLVMPATPFIDGLPGSDALCRRLALCGEEVHNALRRRMEVAYYDAPLSLVDAGLPGVIADLQARGVSIYGLTSRGRRQEQWSYAWHNSRVVGLLAQHTIRFSTLADEHLGPHGENTEAGGILYAGAVHPAYNNKVVLMQAVTRGAPSTLVDNSASKLCKATELRRACVHGVHFTAAWAREATDAERRKWIVMQSSQRSGFDA